MAHHTSVDIELVEASRECWDARAESDRHFLQSWGWGSFQARWGWAPDRRLLIDRATRRSAQTAGSAQILWRRLPGGFRWGYVPKGPTLAVARAHARWSDVAAALRRRYASPGTLFVRLEPPVADSPAARRAMILAGLRKAPRDVQPRHTILVDLARPEDTLLRSMHSKTRYNVRLSARRGVTVRAAAGTRDVETYLRLHEETVRRDGYVGHDRGYLRAFLERFSGCAELLLATARGEEVAGVVVTYAPPAAIYLYGASGERYREDMPNYALQWEAMRRARARGCTTYDLWGVPAPGAAEDPLAGLLRFKHGFGDLVSWIGCWDLPLSPLYPLWRAAEIQRARRRRGRHAR